MDLFKGIGDFFNSVFNQDEKKKKPKEEQPKQPARAVSDMFKTPTAKQTPQTARPDTLNAKAVSTPSPVKPSFNMVLKPVSSAESSAAGKAKERDAVTSAVRSGKMPVYQAPNPVSKTPAQNRLSKEEFNEAVKLGVTRRYQDVNGTTLERAKEQAGILGDLSLQGQAQSIIKIPETVVRSLATSLTGKDQSLDTRNLKVEDPRRILYGREGVQTYQKQGTDINKSLGGEGDNATSFAIGSGLLLLDTFTGGKGRKVAGATEQVIKDAVKVFEEQVGRKVTREERKQIADKVAESVKKQEPTTKTSEPNTAAPTTKIVEEQVTPEQKTVGESYAKVFNQVSNDQNLTPQQKVEFLSEAKARHTKMLDDIKTSQVEEAKAIDTAIKTSQEEQLAREADIAKVQQAQQEQATPPVDEVVTAPTKEPLPQEMEQAANDVYNDTENLIKANEDFRNAQKKTFKDGFDTLRRELYDPQLLTQKVDNETMARLKENNLLKPGQTRLLPSQSVTFQNSLIYNATQATQAKASENGLAQIISKHANADDLNEFAFYRMYKDELWRINNGANNTLPVDPEEMARYVRKYDTERPDWAEDNAMLREIALDNFRARVDAGIDSAEMLRNAEVNPFYSPRRQVEIEDAAKPGVTGSFNRTAKTTKSRQEGVLGTVEAPIDLYMLDTQDTIRGLAVQQRAKLLREAGYEVTQSAEEAARRRDITKEMAILSDAVDQMRTLRNATRKDIKKTKAYSKGEEAKAKAQEDKAINALRKMIEQAKNDPESIWRDLAVRDPRYAPELDAIKKQELPNLSPIERKEQIKFDIQQLNAKYPDPVALKDDELRSIVNQLGEANAFTGDALGASRAASGRTEEANTMVEQLTGLLHQSRQEIADYKQASSDLFEELKEYPINPKTGAAEVTYKVDGAAGKIAIPPQLAREWAALDALYKHSPVGVTLNTIGSLQKATWTGMLSPVFQVLQPLRNLEQMFVNAEGVSAFNPQAVRQFLGSMFSINGGKFREAAQQAGAQYETATRGIMMRRSITDDIINTANIKNFLVRNPFNTLSDVGRGINRAFAHVSNAQRDAVIAGAVARAKNMGMNDADALAYGTEAAVKVFGDFNRVSQVVRALDSTLLPYAGATQAGVRADVRAIKERPAETLAKYGLMLGSMAGIVGWNLQQGMKEYYDDMDAQGRQDDYENNVVIAIGPVSKNADGEWQNIVKAPLTPDFRPLYRETVDTVRTVANGGEFDPVGLGANIFNFFTGDIGSSVYNEKRTDEGKNPSGGFVTSSPIANIGRILSGQNLFDGGQTVDDYTYNKEDRGEQVWDNTSGAGKTLSDLTGNAITPIQVDQILGMFGNAGKSVKEATDGKEGGGLGIFDFTKPFKVANSKTKKEMKGIQYGRDIDDAKAYVAKNYDEKTFKDFVALHAKSTEEQKKSMLTNAIKASQFMNYTGDGTFSTTPLFQAEEYLDKLRRDRGEPGNPIYDLGPQELQAVLTYRSMKIPNAAKQNFTKDGEGAFQSLGLDNKWYSDFQAAESAYWDSVFEGETKENEYKTFSGETKPKLNPEQAALEQQYYSLPEKSPERRAFLDANPWLKDHWAAGNEFTDEERKALGFKPLEADSSSGGGGGNYSPYGAVGTLLNVGKTERLEAADSKEVKANPNFQSLFATRRGGRANAKLGAESKG